MAQDLGEEFGAEAGDTAIQRLIRRLGGLRPQGALETAGMVGLAVVLAAVFVVPLVLQLDPFTIDLDAKLSPPSTAHPFGTDALGRDYLARVLIGGRVSIVIGVLAVVVAGAVGTAIGAVAGYAGGVIDELLMRIADIFLAFPAIMLALVVAGALGPNVANSAVAIAAAWWAGYARLVRGQVIATRDQDFVAASRTLGAGPARILLRTVLPNSLDAIKVIFLLDIAYAILAAATLSYFGLGVQAPNPEWGLMIREATEATSGWWMVIIPGAALLLFAMSVNLVGGMLSRPGLEHQR